MGLWSFFKGLIGILLIPFIIMMITVLTCISMPEEVIKEYIRKD